MFKTSGTDMQARSWESKAVWGGSCCCCNSCYQQQF